MSSYPSKCFESRRPHAICLAKRHTSTTRHRRLAITVISKMTTSLASFVVSLALVNVLFISDWQAECSEPGPCKCSLYLRLASRNTLFTLCAEHHQKISYTERRNRVETGLLSHGLRNSYSFLIPLQGSIISIVHLMASSSLFGAWCKFLRSSHEF